MPQVYHKNACKFATRSHVIDFQFVVTLCGFIIIAPRPSRCKHWLHFAIRFFGKPAVVVHVCEFVTFVYDCDVRQNTRMKPACQPTSSFPGIQRQHDVHVTSWANGSYGRTTQCTDNSEDVQHSSRGLTYLQG